MELASRIWSFMKVKWNAVLNADLYQLWLKTMELLLVVDTSRTNWQTRLFLKNIAILLWFAVLVLEFGYSALSGNEEDAHLSGDLFAGLGVAHLINITALILFCQGILYRLTVIKLTLEGHVMVMNTIRRVVNERNRVLRQRKIRNTRMVLVVAIASVIPFALTAACLFTGLLVLKLVSSQSLFQASCWIFWWLVDVVSCPVVASSPVFFPAVWIMMALNYRMDLCDLIRRVENMNAIEHADRADTMDRISICYDHVVDQALAFHRFSSLILMSLNLSMTPYFVTSLFVVNNAEQKFLTVPIFVLMIPQ